MATLTVTDEDGDDLTERTFYITSGNELGNFTFDTESEYVSASQHSHSLYRCFFCRNVIVTSMKLDYDLHHELRQQTLTIVVNDTLFTDEATVTIQLVDINDNAPVFQNDSYQYNH